MNCNNICKFAPSGAAAPTDINAVNFVLENSKTAQKESIRSVYAIHIITRGQGRFILNGKSYKIEKGDVFFTLPPYLYAIKNDGELEYAYVSFLGGGAPALIKRILPTEKATIFKGNDKLINFWKEALKSANPANTDLIAKSVLEYSAATLIAYTQQEDVSVTAIKIEQYVRLNFTSPALRLKTVAARFGYDEKYLSKLFYRNTGIYFADYLTNLRINAACGLMQQGKTAVKEIALACGFSDPLYFSKVFKNKMGIPPTDFIKENSNHAAHSIKI